MLPQLTQSRASTSAGRTGIATLYTDVSNATIPRRAPCFPLRLPRRWWWQCRAWRARRLRFGRRLFWAVESAFLGQTLRDTSTTVLCT